MVDQISLSLHSFFCVGVNEELTLFINATANNYILFYVCSLASSSLCFATLRSRVTLFMATVAFPATPLFSHYYISRCSLCSHCRSSAFPYQKIQTFLIAGNFPCLCTFFDLHLNCFFLFLQSILVFFNKKKRVSQESNALENCSAFLKTP